ncbi:MAG: Holliday junction resolvase RuvX [Planctomycetota bacterium]|jgi:putative Holliday junction resolvase
MRYLAIDYGLKRTGLAICDEAETIASPLMTIVGRKNLISKIAEIVKNENVGGIVLGMPLNMDDSEGTQAKLVQKFAKQLKEAVNIPLHFQDERLSTFAAEEKLADIELGKAKKRSLLDALAAAEILQSFMEEKKGGIS